MTKLRFNLHRLLFVILITLLTGGCWDLYELSKLAIVLGLGIDRDEASDQVLVTVQIVRPGEVKGGGGGEGQGSGSGGGGGGQAAPKTPPVLIIQNKAPDLAQALLGFNLLVDRRLYLHHNQVIILGRAIAEQGVRPFIEYLFREVEIRETTWIIVTDRKASDLLNAQFGLESIPAAGVARLVEERGLTSTASGITLHEFINRLLSKTMAPYASLIRVYGNAPHQKVHLDGTAVFKNDRMVGFLNSRETRGFLLSSGKWGQGIITGRFDKGYADFLVVRSDSKITPSLQGNRVRIKITVNAQSRLNNLTTPIDFSQPKNIQKLEQVESSAIRQVIQEAIEKAQSLGTDIFGFGEVIHRKYPKKWKQIEPQWDQYFRNAQFNYQINAKIRSFGLIIRPLTTK